MIPFGPTNAPPLYTAMMNDLKNEWDKLCILRLMALKIFNGKDIRFSAAGVVTIDNKSLIYCSKTVINDILQWCDAKDLILLFFL